MKTNDLITIAAAGVLSWIVIQILARKKTGQTGYAYSNPALSITNNADPGEPGWGWSYFTDGTSIGPDGTYFKNGAKVWSPQ